MKPTILFADNERGIRQFCCEELEADGFRVVLAEDGEEAVSLLDAETVDLAILDEYMPRCGGRESAERIKRLHAQLPVILFTADAFFESYRSPLVDATMIKSTDLSDLRSAIARLLPQRSKFTSRTSAPSGARQSSIVGVNSAFFQEIKDENVRFSSLLISLRAWLSRGPAAYHQRVRFIQLLTDLQDELALHFSLEEAYGYFEQAAAVAPELSSRAIALRDEHLTLYAEIRRLLDQAMAARSSVTGFANVMARARAFWDQLQEHESRERELILQVYDDDLGVGD